MARAEPMMDVQIAQSADEIRRLQRCLNDIVSLLALPAIWTGGDPALIGRTLLDVLPGMVGLDLVYLRLTDSGGDDPLELARVSGSELPDDPVAIGRLIEQRLGPDPSAWPPFRRILTGQGELSVVVVPLGLRDVLGVLVAGSARPTFPGQTEQLLLAVAANQAAIGLQKADLLGERKGPAGELNARVSQDTRELALANQELQLRAGLLQSIPVAAWTILPDGAPDFVSQSWLEYTGQTLEYVHSHPEAWMSAIHPDDRKRASRSFWDGLRSGLGYTMEARFRRADDGTYRWHLNRAVPLRDADGKLLRLVGTSTDIEDLKQSQERFRESELSLRQLTETIPEMLWSATPDGMIDYCNARLLDYTGLPADDVMGTGWIKMLHPDDVEPTAAVWQACIATGAPYRVEVRILAADRTYRWCVTNALPLVDREGRIVKWHGTVVDMHDWKQAQEQLRHTQAELAHVTRVMTMGELTASIAHEVNQPLAGIITNASTCLRMLAADPPNLEGARETARRTIRDGNRASEVIARLRALFSRKAITAEPVDLNQATLEVVTLCSIEMRKNRVIVLPELADDLPLVMGDRIQLQQVVLNLLLNASDAMSQVQGRPRQLLIRTDQTEPGQARLVVKDVGVGIEPEAAARLFEPFYTTKSNGMGIGLSVCRSIIESHGGRLWAEPNDGPGATFSFSLPCASGEPTGPFASAVLRRPAPADTRQTIRAS